MTSVSFTKGAFIYNPEDFSRSKIYQEILLEDDSRIGFFTKPRGIPGIFWASLPPSLGFTGSDFLGKSLLTENRWWNKGIEEEKAETETCMIRIRTISYMFSNNICHYMSIYYSCFVTVCNSSLYRCRYLPSLYRCTITDHIT